MRRAKSPERTDAFAEPVGLTELEADAFGGLLEARAVRVLRPQLENALLLFIQVGGAGGEPIEDARVFLLRLLDALLALLLRKVRGQLHHLVDDAEVVLVVQQSALGRDLGVHASPECDVRLQLRGTHERAFVRDRGQRRQGESKHDEEQQGAEMSLIHCPEQTIERTGSAVKTM